MEFIELIKYFPFKMEVLFSLLVLVIIGVIKWGLNKIINKKVDSIAAKYRWRKITTYLAFFIGLILILPMWFKGFETLGTFLGISTAGIAIALRDLLASVVGWIVIIWKRPFSLGDRIEIEGTAGDVVDIRIFQFSLLEIGNWVESDQSTGRVVHFPNNRILTSKVANYTAGFNFIWNEIPVLVTFESDWEKARSIMMKIAEDKVGNLAEVAQEKIKKASHKFLIYYGKLTPIVYTSVKESGVLLTLRYMCEPQRRRTTEGEIWEEILKAFRSEEQIDLAYPTQRFYIKEPEMKKGMNAINPDEREEINGIDDKKSRGNR
jgi:small-conductance mechanosensitive channel